MSTDEIPNNELSEYLSADLHATQQLADKIMYNKLIHLSMQIDGTVDLQIKSAVTLAKIHQRGFKVDKIN